MFLIIKIIMGNLKVPFPGSVSLCRRCRVAPGFSSLLLPTLHDLKVAGLP